MSVVLITGGSRGIGKAMVESFKAEGHTVLACASSITSLRYSKADYAFECDVTNPIMVREEISKVISIYSKVDILICNAGVAKANLLDLENSDEIWHQTIDVNLNGSYYFAKECAPFLSKKSGRLIFIGSVSSFRGSDRLSAYATSKHAIIGLMLSFAKRLAPDGICVNAICPGFVDTEMTDSYLEDSQSTRDDLLKRIPLRRLISPKEISSLAIYLSSSNASAITGQAITIDAGLLL